MPSLINLTSATRVTIGGVKYIQLVLTDIDGLQRTLNLQEADYAMLKAVTLASL